VPAFSARAGCGRLTSAFRWGRIASRSDGTADSDPSSLSSWRVSAQPRRGATAAADLDFYVDEFSRTGFRGGLNWYRNIDRNWVPLSSFAGAKIAVPALYVADERDVVLGFPGAKELMANLKVHVPQLRQTILLPGYGHWTQQERPEAVNAALLSFLSGVQRKSALWIVSIAGSPTGLLTVAAGDALKPCNRRGKRPGVRRMMGISAGRAA